MLRVLMAEDREDDALLVQRALRVAGFDVSVRRVETAVEDGATFTVHLPKARAR